jgi:hypothetical protein
MQTLGRARATSCFVLWALVLLMLRPPPVYGQVLGGPPEIFIALGRSWAAESDGIFYASISAIPRRRRMST